MNEKTRVRVAVVGALGLVGTEMIRTLGQRKFPVSELRPLDLQSQSGKKVSLAGRTFEVLPAIPENFTGVDVALFSAGSEASLALAPEAVKRGAVVVDNSAAWRMDPKCPLVVPEVNPYDLEWHQGIIANPNCSTIQMVVALKPIHDAARIKRIVVSTYQAASGAGLGGATDLEDQTLAWSRKQPAPQPKAFGYPIAFNVVPQIDVFQEGGYTKEEYKMVHETTKIMGDPGIKVTATCVRVPVFKCHSEAVNIETERKITAVEARRLLSDAAGVIVIDDPNKRQYPMPVLAAGQDAVYVGRIREDCTVANGLNLWIVADNVRKGAALNAVQIAETMLQMKLLSRCA